MKERGRKREGDRERQRDRQTDRQTDRQRGGRDRERMRDGALSPVGIRGYQTGGHGGGHLTILHSSLKALNRIYSLRHIYFCLFKGYNNVYRVKI